MDRSYDKERLIDKIMEVYDPEYTDHDKYVELQNVVDKGIDKLTIKKSKLEQLVVSLKDEPLLITYDFTTNIVDIGHDGKGALWIDLSVEIKDVVSFTEWLQDTVVNVDSLKDQNDIEEFVRDYLEKHKANFFDIGLQVVDYQVN